MAAQRGGGIRLSHPVRAGIAPKLTFAVHGQCISNLIILDDSLLDARGSDISNKAKIMARIGTAIGAAADSGTIVMQHLTYTFQPVATIRDRAVTALDRWTEGAQLVVLDAQRWLPHGRKLVCPHAVRAAH